MVVTSADDTRDVKQLAREQGVDLFLSRLELLDELEDVVRHVLPATLARD